MSDLRNVIGAKEFQNRVKSKLIQNNKWIQEDDLYFSQTAKSYYIEYKPNYPERSNGDFIVCQDLNGLISVYGNLDATIPTIKKYNDIKDFENRL